MGSVLLRNVDGSVIEDLVVEIGVQLDVMMVLDERSILITRERHLHIGTSEVVLVILKMLLSG